MKPLTEENIISAVSLFDFKGEYTGYEVIHAGHINDTFLINFKNPEGRFILQRLNTKIFTNPDGVMSNIRKVTKFIAKKVAARGGNPDIEVLNVIKTKDGGYYAARKEGYFRAYLYIDGVAYNESPSAELFEQSGYAFGKFQMDLDGFPSETLVETIPHFHDTKKRYETFLKVIDEDACGRAKDCLDVIEGYKAFAYLKDAYDGEDIPLRVTHNDTKLNNVMMDPKTNKPLAVIDLDTVMPGYAMNDFGDSIRFGANTAKENETDLSKIRFSLEMFKAYAEGFLSACGNTLTKAEKDRLAVGAMVMTFECGMRFLTDHLSGDTYFKISHPGENLERAINQLTLLRSMDAQFSEMKAVIEEHA